MREVEASQSQLEETQVPTVMNPEMWVQLTVEQHQKTSQLLEEQQQQTAFLLNTVQQLQEEMIRVWKDNERLLQDQEKILKCLSDKQNQEMGHPSVEKELSTEQEEQQTRNKNTGRTEKSPSRKSKNKNYNEGESGNVSDQQDPKSQKVELQGEFRKIKPPTFDGEAEEVAEAWLININKYFQVYEYSSNLKARLAIYQLREKATRWWEEVKNVCNVDK